MAEKFTSRYEYQIGDQVKCLDADNTGLTENEVYTVDTPGTFVIGLRGVTSVQYTWRFVLVTAASQIALERSVSRNG